MKRQRELLNPPKISIPNPEHIQSFRFSNWETVLLEKGDRVYRLFTPNENYETGFFWFDEITFNAITRNGTDMENLINNARAGLAVKEKWSSKMNRLTIGNIKGDFFTAYGSTNFQKMTGHNNVYHIGGFNQLYIMQENWDKISSFASIGI